MYPRDIRF